jgi:hypothetical protein
MQPTWDFTQFFQQKEGLAFLYETFHMYEEALMQYDELEALFTTGMTAAKRLSCDR